MMSGDEEEEGGYKYDAVVLGFGYGGSVAACWISMVGIKVCLLEKGGKWEARDFPTNTFSLLSVFRMETQNCGFNFGPKEALLLVYQQDDSLTTVACGLGGGSLVNAGVIVSTPIRTKRDKKWPEEWNSDWEICEAAASTMLRAESPRVEFPSTKVMREVVEEIEDCSSSSIKLSINFESMESSPQIGSFLAYGNRLSGCPYNAKSSTDKNYLASAVQIGYVIKTESQAQYVVRNLNEGYVDGVSNKLRRRWRVYLNEIDYVLCDFVIISVGVCGTAEILFQSPRRGLMDLAPMVITVLILQGAQHHWLLMHSLGPQKSEDHDLDIKVARARLVRTTNGVRKKNIGRWLCREAPGMQATYCFKILPWKM